MALVIHGEDQWWRMSDPFEAGTYLEEDHRMRSEEMRGEAPVRELREIPAEAKRLDENVHAIEALMDILSERTAQIRGSVPTGKGATGPTDPPRQKPMSPIGMWLAETAERTYQIRVRLNMLIQEMQI